MGFGVVRGIGFNRTNNNITDKLVFKYLKFTKDEANTKYSERSPKIAMMLLVNTINSSSVIDIIAGIESSANNKSVNAITIKARKDAVMKISPPFL